MCTCDMFLQLRVFFAPKPLVYSISPQRKTRKIYHHKPEIYYLLGLLICFTCKNTQTKKFKLFLLALTTSYQTQWSQYLHTARVSPKKTPMNQLWDRYLHVCHWWLILLAEGAADRLGVQECEEAGECVRPHVPHGHDVSDHHWPHSEQGQVGPIHLKISFYTII